MVGVAVLVLLLVLLLCGGVDTDMLSDEEEEDEPLFPAGSSSAGGRGEASSAGEPASSSGGAASSIYGAADAAKRNAARAELAEWQRRLDAETEQFRVWRTEREAESREEATAVALVTTELGERYFATGGVALSRMSAGTVQLVSLAYPLAPVTHSLSPAAVAVAQRVAATRQQLARAEKMLSAASSFKQLEDAKRAFDDVLAVDSTNQRAREGSDRANARLDQTLVVRDRTSIEPARPSLEGLGGSGHHGHDAGGAAILAASQGSMGTSEAERVARLLQAEVIEMRTVVERLELDKRQVVEICRSLEREAASLRARRDKDAQTIAQLQEELWAAKVVAADTEAKLADYSAAATAAAQPAAESSQHGMKSTSIVQNDESTTAWKSRGKGAVRTPKRIATMPHGNTERISTQQCNGSDGRCAGQELLDDKGELTEGARDIFTGWFLSVTGALGPTATSTSSSSQPPGSALAASNLSCSERGGEGDDEEEATYGLLGRADAAVLFSKVTGVTLSSSSLPIERLFSEYCKGSGSQQPDQKEGLRLSEYLSFYREACRQQGPLVSESIRRMEDERK